MKICQKCGCLYNDDNMFCENCGLKLTPQMQSQEMQNTHPIPKKKKRNLLLFLISVAIILMVLVLLFLFRDKLPFGNKRAAIQETDQQEETDPQEDTSKQKISGETKSSENEKEEKEESESEKVNYTDAEINGVDNAYVQVTGTVVEKEGRILLKLEKSSSVCAYDEKDQIIQKKNVEEITLDESGMEEYLGDKVEIKGKLSVNLTGYFFLEAVKTDVKQQAKGEETDSADHRYQLIQADVTWQEAFEDCISRGGTLVRINSEEEYQSVITLIENENMQNIHFYLGGRRNGDSQKYYWVNEDNIFVGEMLNPEGQSWAAGYWMENEPSFTSEDDIEQYMNLIYYKGSWVLNDVPLDITLYYPGKTGYICEFNE